MSRRAALKLARGAGPPRPAVPPAVALPGPPAPADLAVNKAARKRFNRRTKRAALPPVAEGAAVPPRPPAALQALPPPPAVPVAKGAGRGLPPPPPVPPGLGAEAGDARTGYLRQAGYRGG
eukprot:3081296-Heterocapsa_arctica.AAC.1